MGSLSEAATVFDAERLKEIIAELGAELKPLGRDARLKDIDLTRTLVDGTLLAVPRIATNLLFFSAGDDGVDAGGGGAADAYV